MQAAETLDQVLPELPRIEVRSHFAASPAAAQKPPQWLLFNDFCVWPTTSAEVTQLYGLQKIPCLLYYTKVQPLCRFASSSLTTSLK